MKNPPSVLHIACSHLEDQPLLRELLRPRKARPARVSLNGGGTQITVRLCRDCADRLGADSEDPNSLRLAAMTVLQRHIHSRLADVVEKLGEILPLLSRPHSKP
ncbi:MAG: hypothetical protein GY769_10055 [bacterium]|nr:hypothetical protein [bacterium]